MDLISIPLFEALRESPHPFRWTRRKDLNLCACTSEAPRELRGVILYASDLVRCERVCDKTDPHDVKASRRGSAHERSPVHIERLPCHAARIL